jgi:hypothetical protein
VQRPADAQPLLAWQVARLHAAKLHAMAAELAVTGCDSAVGASEAVAAFNALVPVLAVRPAQPATAQAVLISAQIRGW